jgi:putative FmdB family regulatory protein
MPIYEYDCPRCGTFEKSQKMSDPPLSTHEECGQPVERRISLTSFSLKGSGWASDGYSSTSGKAGMCGGGGCGSGACGMNPANA